MKYLAVMLPMIFLTVSGYTFDPISQKKSQFENKQRVVAPDEKEKKKKSIQFSNYDTNLIAQQAAAAIQSTPGIITDGAYQSVTSSGF
jgi:hypothetical protein